MINYLPIITTSVAIIALFLGVYAFWQLISLNKMRKTFFSGNKAGNLEDVIMEIETELINGQERQKIIEGSLNNLRIESQFAISQLGLVRFNPFEDGGGNFSFSLALLDSHNNGLVITSMHGRQQNRIYTKKITNGNSEMQLTDEEQQAIIQANSKK